MARRTFNIKSWIRQPSSPSCPYIQKRGQGPRNYDNFCKFRSSRLEVLHKKISVLKILEIFHGNNLGGVLFQENCKVCNCTKIGLHRGCFPGNFPKSVEQSFWTATSVIGLYLHRYLVHSYLIVHRNRRNHLADAECGHYSLCIILTWESWFTMRIFRKQWSTKGFHEQTFFECNT